MHKSFSGNRSNKDILEVLGSIPPGRNVDPIKTSDGGTFHGLVFASYPARPMVEATNAAIGPTSAHDSC